MVEPTEMPELQARLEKVRRNTLSAAGGGRGGGGSIDERTNGRLRAVENDISALKSALDWAKTYATVWMAIVLAGFSALFAIALNTNSKVDAISSKIGDEFRAQRQDISAQVSAIANSITAAKQQQPQSTEPRTQSSSPK